MRSFSDGTLFEGEAIGVYPEDGIASGEFVFNTVLCGYQEVLSDPSYAGQVITFTYPHVGNYGVNAADNESARTHCRGVVMRDLARRASNHRSEGGLATWLSAKGIPGVAGVDTRRLTRHIRDHGAIPGVFGIAGEGALRDALGRARSTDGIDLVATVTDPDGRSVPSRTGRNQEDRGVGPGHQDDHRGAAGPVGFGGDRTGGHLGGRCART
ncbi:MAG: hypothetical protein M5U19_04555 [Microthrixaceae bacterium]|nr:hypothetical protein [Microthrixaceae bacterium]